jgi:hypothetical protein
MQTVSGFDFRISRACLKTEFMERVTPSTRGAVEIGRVSASTSIHWFWSAVGSLLFSILGPD